MDPYEAFLAEKLARLRSNLDRLVARAAEREADKANRAAEYFLALAIDTDRRIHETQRDLDKHLAERRSWGV